MGFSSKTATTITAWSFSRWNTYVKCPRKAYYKFVMKMKEESGPAAERGSMIDKVLETMLLARKMPAKLIPEVRAVRRHVEKLRAAKAKPQVELAVNSAWRVTGWFAPDTWCRVKIDALAFKGKLAGVTDWKSGKYKPDNPSYDLQLNLYGTGVLAAYPKVEEVETRLVFTDHKGKGPIKIYTRDELEEMKKAWEARVRPMLSDRRFAPLPSYECTYCAFSKKRKGPCNF